MNVKAFLAGRRGLCPVCGAKFDIPFQSEEAALAGDSSEKSGAAKSGEASVDESTDTIVLDLPNLAAPPVMPTEPWVSPGEPTAAEHQAAVGSVAPSISAAEPPSPSNSDRQGQHRPTAPPSTRWYVRLGTGEQFGPVRDEIMREWFAEGRITANTPIWREGWSDWHSASAAFGAAGELGPTPPQVSPRQMSSADLTAAILSDLPAAIAKARQRQSWTQRQWKTFISLSLLGLILILGTIILVMMLSQLQQPESPPPTQPPPAKSPLGNSSSAASVLA